MADRSFVDEYYCCPFPYQALDAHGVEGRSVTAHSVADRRELHDRSPISLSWESGGHSVIGSR